MRKSRKPTQAIGTFKKKDAGSQPSDTWVVFTKGPSGRPVKARMYSGSMTRDRVRLAYSNETGIGFTATRSRRISNYR